MSKKPSKTKAAAQSAGITLAVVLALILIGLLLDYGSPGLFGGDDPAPAGGPGPPP